MQLTTGLGDSSGNKSNANLSSLANMMPALGLFSPRSPEELQAKKDDENGAGDNSSCAYLSVHSGISSGLMAGIDVGANDRWEYLLVGDPIGEVADAESQAGVGEVVITPASHEIIHPNSAPLKTTTRPSAIIKQKSTLGSKPTFGSGGNLSSMRQNSEAVMLGESKSHFNIGKKQFSQRAMMLSDTTNLFDEKRHSCGCVRTANNFFAVKVSTSSLEEVNENDNEKIGLATDHMNDEHEAETQVTGKRKHSMRGLVSIVKCFGVRKGSKAPGLANLDENSTQLELEESSLHSVDLAVATGQQPSPYRKLGSIPQEHEKSLSHLLADYGNTDDFVVEQIASQATEEVEDAYTAMKLFLGDDYDRNVKKIIRKLEEELQGNTHGASNSKGLEAEEIISLDYTNEGKLKSHFLKWMHNCLLDDISRHVHEAARTEFRLRMSSRQQVHHQFMKFHIKTLKMYGKQHIPLRRSSGSSAQMVDAIAEKKSAFKAKQDQQSRSRIKSSSRSLLLQDVGMTAELRSVVVLFVRIEHIEAELLVDEGRFTSTRRKYWKKEKEHQRNVSAYSLPDIAGAVPVIANKPVETLATKEGVTIKNCFSLESFDFLERSEAEINADDAIVCRVQSCMRILTSSLSEKGGQLRQFIVDDKGTVCIGTFGLRGSTTDDNAAAAISAANAIIKRVSDIGLSASIGVTSGKAYCGLVGSPARHEYAVMGPSTNLSARLMCKAPPNDAICDVETRKRDRTHTFVVLSEVTAKGYSQPVQTFKPLQTEFTLEEQQMKAVVEYAGLATIDISYSGTIDYTDMEGLQVSPGKNEDRSNNFALYPSVGKNVGDLLSDNPRNRFITEMTTVDYVLNRLGSFRNSRGSFVNSAADAAVISAVEGSPAIQQNLVGQVVEQQTREVKLHGRDAEICMIIRFLFPSIFEPLAVLVRDMEHQRGKANSISHAVISRDDISNSWLRRSGIGKEPMDASGSNKNPARRSSAVNDAVHVIASVIGGDIKASLIKLPTLNTALGSINLGAIGEGGKTPSNSSLYTSRNRRKSNDIDGDVYARVRRGSIRSSMASAQMVAMQEATAAAVAVAMAQTPRIDEETPRGALNGVSIDHRTRRISQNKNSLRIATSGATATALASLRIVDKPIESGAKAPMDSELPVLFGSPTKQDSTNSFNPTDHSVNLFDVSQNCRMAVVVGPQGIGKSALIDAMCKKIEGISKLEENCNITVFRMKKYSSYGNMSSPFFAWKNIINEMVFAIMRLKKMERPLVQSKRDPSKAPALSTASNIPDASSDIANATGARPATRSRARRGRRSVDLTSGFDFVAGKLPVALQKYSPLLKVIHTNITDVVDNEHTAPLRGQIRLTLTCEVLAAIIQQYSVLSNNLAVICMDNLQSIDDASYQLLRKVWYNNTGCVIFGAFQAVADRTDSENADSLSDLKSQFYQLAPFMNSDRYLQLQFGAVAPLALKALIMDDLCTHDITTIDPEALEKIAQLSGGNPLYAHELTKSIVEKAGDSKTVSIQVLSDILSGALSNRIEEVICQRFDRLDPDSQLLLKMAAVACSNGAYFSYQMLSYMMDDAASPRAVKGHGIAGSKSEEILRQDSDGSHRSDSSDARAVKTFNLLKTLRDILTKEHFIEVLPSATRSEFDSLEESDMLNNSLTSTDLAAELATTKDDKQSEPEVAPRSRVDSIIVADVRKISDKQIMEYTFQFRIVLEQMTIYDLLLNDQKESLHDRVASYHRSKTYTDHKAITAEQLHEQGFHWEHATVWSSAMTCYYNAAMTPQLDVNIKARRSYLVSAYKMYTEMRKEAKIYRSTNLTTDTLRKAFAEEGLSLSISEKVARPPLTHSKSIQNLEIGSRRSSINLSVHSSVDSPSVTEGAQMSIDTSPLRPKAASGVNKQNIGRLFSNSSTLLSTALKVMSQLAQTCVTMYDAPSIYTRLYDEALELALVAGLHKNAYLGIDSEKDSETNKESNGDLITFDDHGDVSFTSTMKLADHSVLFPIISGFLSVNSSSFVMAEERIEKLRLVSEAFVELTKGRGFSKIHECVALSHMIHQNILEADYTSATKIMNLLRSKYIYEEHSSLIFGLYGVDRVPASLAVIISYLVSFGDFDSVNELFTYLIHVQGQMTHMASLNLLVYPLCSILAFLRRYQEAVDVFIRYMEIETHADCYHHLERVNSVFIEWLTRLNKYEQFEETTDIHLFDDDSATIDDLILHPDSTSPLMYNNNDFDELYAIRSMFYAHCRGVEFLFAHMALTKILVMLAFAESQSLMIDNALIENYIRSAIFYIDLAIDVSAELSNYLIHSFINCLLLRVKIMQIANQLPSLADEYPMTDVLEVLGSIESVADQHSFTYVTLLVGVHYEITIGNELVVDGVQMQMNAIKDMMAYNKSTHSNSGFKLKLFRIMQHAIPSVSKHTEMISRYSGLLDDIVEESSEKPVKVD